MFRTALISLFITSTALATTWTVDDDGKADFDNIQAAVDAASNGDEIVVMPGTYTGTGDEVVDTLGKEIWLHSSAGAEVTIIDGESARTVLECTSNETNLTIIEGLTLTGGFSTYAGGGVYCNGSPMIKDCVIEGNSADYGAGIYCRYTIGLEIINCQIKDNSASIDGGGIYTSWGIVNLTNCVLENNTAGVGGGLSSEYSATTNVTNCLFFNNTAKTGGGFSNEGSDLTFYKTTISSNQALASRGRGGGGYSRQGYSGGSFSFLRMYSCLFDGNEADSEGGGFYLDTGSTNDDSEIVNCTFRNNSAYGNAVARGGGAIYFNDDINITNCVFESNTTQSTERGGAGIYCGEYCHNATISNCTFIDNASENGGGGLSAFGGGGVQTDLLIVRDCVFENNTGRSGGALNFYNGVLEISDCIVTDNHSEFGGGGFWIGELWSTSFIDNCTISNNQATEGGGIYFLQSTAYPLLLTDTTVCGNWQNQIYGNLTDNGGNWVEDECPIGCPDINGDGYVNVSDLLAVIDQWGLTNSPADVNFDGIVNVTDLLIVIGNWGPCEQ